MSGFGSRDKVTTWLWCDGTAEEMARLYTGLIPDSRIGDVVRAPAENPAVGLGKVLTVGFTLGGRSFVAMNGGPGHGFSEAMSLQLSCADQAEVDRYWDALTADGGKAVQCGWLKDRFGVSWQIVPDRLAQLMADSDRARAGRAMRAMMTMVKIDIAAIEAAADGDDA
ncbi:VOC family protein [Sphingomonas sp. KR1UV-12]|uniref:VOC family protein n=1 Tax=Sphingomonas aurea TaxID=3063994 RepID=A0ABT9ELA9_9SPHN|nr:VOC family protein [Sphingomonas sp. KR1UV-12]MDP1027413.1 VOC family protein [Sphingomonas sp. KR1UV-12]